MVIDKVHGLQATGVSLNDRFTMLTTVAPAAPVRARTPRRQPSVGNFFNPNMNLKNRNLIEQIARRLEQQARMQSVRQRLGVGRGGLRRIGSESSLVGFGRTGSYAALTQRSVKSRLTWNNTNGNLSRSASFSNLSSGGGRGMRFRRRGGGPRALRGRFRGGVSIGRATRAAPRAQRGRRGRGQATRARGRGGVSRNQTPKQVPTKEELDEQLDRYMAGTKSALDQELDAYMKNAMDME